MLLMLSGDEPVNPWKAKVPAAVEQARAQGTVSALRTALDVAWRADDWQAGLQVAQQALQAHADEATLHGPVTRALWRAGWIHEAEKLAAKIPADTTDHVALRTRLTICLARGEADEALRLAARLATLPNRDAEDLSQVFAARLLLNRLDGLAEILRQTEPLIDPQQGYPHVYLQESIAGVADFLDAVGTEPLNQVTRHGSAPMPPLVLLNLPSCDVMINGHGPYRMVVDTGGSIMVALDTAVAEEIGLKSHAQASVRGMSGTQETGQALIDELQIGSIRCRRVMTRTFGVREAIMNAADGILGTGIFGGSRLTLGFSDGQLAVTPSRMEPAAGQAVELRLVADAKLVAPVTLQGEQAVALLDTGADAVALAPSRLERIFPDRKIQTFDPGVAIGVGSGELPKLSLNPGVDLVFAGRTYENYSGVGLDVLDTILSPVLGVQTDILIGMASFRDVKSLTVDFPRCRLWIEWLE